MTEQNNDILEFIIDEDNLLQACSQFAESDGAEETKPGNELSIVVTDSKASNDKR